MLLEPEEIEYEREKVYSEKKVDEAVYLAARVLIPLMGRGDFYIRASELFDEMIKLKNEIGEEKGIIASLDLNFEETKAFDLELKAMRFCETYIGPRGKVYFRGSLPEAEHYLELLERKKKKKVVEESSALNLPTAKIIPIEANGNEKGEE